MKLIHTDHVFADGKFLGSHGQKCGCCVFADNEIVIGRLCLIVL